MAVKAEATISLASVKTVHDASVYAVQQARIAGESATKALTGLAYVEDVVGTLNWIAQHGQYGATTDTEVQAGKLYFTRTGAGTTADPYVYTVVNNPTGNPSTQGWYELTGVDEAVANYVSTHLALTETGLYVLKDGNGSKLRITNTSIDMLDENDESVASYGDSVRIGKAGNNFHQILTDSGTEFYASNSNKILDISATNQGVSNIHRNHAGIGFGDYVSAIYATAHDYYTDDYQHSAELTIQGADNDLYDYSEISAEAKVLRFVGDTIYLGGDSINANVSINGSYLNDFVIAEGTDGGWAYRKWKSGKVEAWKTHTFENVTFTGAGALYRSGALSFSLPSAFTSAPMIFTSVPSSDTILSADFSASSASTATGKLFKLSSGQATVSINLYAVQL